MDLFGLFTPQEGLEILSTGPSHITTVDIASSGEPLHGAPQSHQAPHDRRPPSSPQHSICSSLAVTHNEVVPSHHRDVCNIAPQFSTAEDGLSLERCDCEEAGGRNAIAEEIDSCFSFATVEFSLQAELCDSEHFKLAFTDGGVLTRWGSQHKDQETEIEQNVVVY